MPDRGPVRDASAGVDRGDVLRATALALLVVASLVATQVAVAAAATGGDQPVSVVERVPTRPGADAWERAPSRTVTLSKQQMALPFGGGSTDRLHVRVLTNESHVGFRLAWTDPTRDTSLASPQQYSDAVAIMARDGSMPPITMGAAGTPVNIWYWRANWQYGRNDAEWTGDMYAYPHPADETKPGLAANNPISTALDGRSAQNLYAKGFGSLSHASVQNVHARGTRTEEGWAVTFVRERSTTGAYDAAFDGSEPTYLAFAVWNGSAGEAYSRKSITLQFSRLSADGRLVAASGAGGGSTASDGTEAAGRSLVPYALLFVVTFVLVLLWGRGK